MARILVIDDEEQLRGMLRELFEKMGHTVVEAENGDVGVQEYRKQPADVVITDIVMPEKSGIGSILSLKREYPDVKMIAISGHSRVGDKDLLDLARELGAEYAMTKPFKMAEIADCVNKLLEEDE
ncbi:MAG: response regulator [Candidatus Sumerlaeia bacterium]